MRLTVLFMAALIWAGPAFAQNWTAAWYAAPEPSAVTASVENVTVRQVARLSTGGKAVRITLSNAYGTEPLRLDEVHIARRAGDSRIDPASDRALTFGGQSEVMIAPGGYVISDAVPLPVSANDQLAISVYVQKPTPLLTVHDMQRDAAYAAPGRLTSAAQFPAETLDLGVGNAFPWIAAVSVEAAPVEGVVVAFGDSITDGFGIDRDKGATWPEVLNSRFTEAGIPLAVVNAGISGNRLWHNGQWARFGTAALARFDRDVLAQPDVKAVIILIGINDLGHAQGPGTAQYVSAEEIIAAYRQMAQRARERGLKVYIGTLLPFKGTTFDGYYSDAKEAERQKVNDWIRSADLFDGVIDFDRLMEDPARPGWLKPEYDVGDRLHPNTAGASEMARGISLSLFDWARTRTRP